MSKSCNLIKSTDLTSCVIILIIGFLFLNPFPHMTALKEMFFYTAIGLVFLATSMRRRSFSFDTPLSPAFACILLWACVSILHAVNKPNTISDIYAHLIKYYAVYFIIVNYFDSRTRQNALVWSLIAAIACFCIWSSLYYYVFLGFPLSAQLGVVFKEIPTNIIGIVTVFGILLCLGKLQEEMTGWLKGALIAIIIVMTVTTLLTQTRGAILAIFVSLLILSFRHRKMLIFIIVVIVLITVLPVKSRLGPSAVIEKIRSDDRIRIAYTFIEVVKDFPLQGIGFGLQSYADEAFMKVYHERVDPNRRTAFIYAAPHNFVVDILVRLGIIGLALYLYLLYRAFGMIIVIIKDNRNDERRGWGFIFFATLVAFLFQGMFENVHSGPPAIVFYVQLAMITILWNEACEALPAPAGNRFDAAGRATRMHTSFRPDDRA